MKTLDLKSNADLFDYLLSLAALLELRGQAELATEVSAASRFASGSPSEFLHEAQTVLKKVVASQIALLSDKEAADVERAIKQIELAFRRVGGG